MQAGDRIIWLEFAQRLALTLGAAGAIWLVTYLFRGNPAALPVALILLFGGLHFIFNEKKALPIRNGLLAKRGVGVLLIALAAWAFVPSAPEAEMEWQPYSLAAIEEAKKEGRPVMIDFYADWCGPCHRLDREVLSKQKVVDAADRFVRLRADVTDNQSPRAQEILQRHVIRGFPTVLFINSEGEEMTGLRVLGVTSVNDFLGRMQAVE